MPAIITKQSPQQVSTVLQQPDNTNNMTPTQPPRPWGQAIEAQDVDPVFNLAPSVASMMIADDTQASNNCCTTSVAFFAADCGPQTPVPAHKSAFLWQHHHANDNGDDDNDYLASHVFDDSASECGMSHVPSVESSPAKEPQQAPACFLPPGAPAMLPRHDAPHSITLSYDDEVEQQVSHRGGNFDADMFLASAGPAFLPSPSSAASTTPPPPIPFCAEQPSLPHNNWSSDVVSPVDLGATHDVRGVVDVCFDACDPRAVRITFAAGGKPYAPLSQPLAVHLELIPAAPGTPCGFSPFVTGVEEAAVSGDPSSANLARGDIMRALADEVMAWTPDVFSETPLADCVRQLRQLLQ